MCSGVPDLGAGRKKKKACPHQSAINILTRRAWKLCGRALKDQELIEDSMARCVLHLFCLIFLVGVKVMSL